MSKVASISKEVYDDIQSEKIFAIASEPTDCNGRPFIALILITALGAGTSLSQLSIGILQVQGSSDRVNVS